MIDIDTGFGEAMSVARTIQELEELGLSGCHLEDQVNPKRCGHLDNKSLIPIDEMTRKISAAANAKTDPNFMLFARTDARAVEGMDKAIDRAKAYVDAGADAIFPEAMQDENEFETFRRAIDVPMMANMTEFGKSPLLSASTLAGLGYNLVIYPATTLRLAMGAIQKGLEEISKTGTQSGLVQEMQTRAQLYELIRYEDYNKFDQDVFNFKIYQIGKWRQESRMAFPIDMCTPIFVMSRITGWTAHIMEQVQDNRLIRPLLFYKGVKQRSVTTISGR